MSKHDEDIRKAKKEIERLSAEIEKKKARIAELRENIKILEAKKAEDLKISDAVLAMLNENDVDSDAEREAVIRKMQDYIREIREAREKNSLSESEHMIQETVQEEETDLTVETEPEETNIAEEASETEAEPTTASAGNYRTAPTATYQNPAYSYRPTNNGNINS